MNANQKKHKITIQHSISPIKQASGSEKKTYTDYLPNIWADVQFINGTKTVANGEIVNTAIINVYIDYRDGISDDMIIIYKKNRYKINFCREVGNKEALQINVEKIT
jgi:SPP1 family predicted phage head-tail adaptor